MLPRAFSVLFLALVLPLFAVARSPGKDPAQADSLFSQFQLPPNGKLEGAQVQEQVAGEIDFLMNVVGVAGGAGVGFPAPNAANR